MGQALIVFAVIAGGALLALVIMYNGFVMRRNGMRNAFASIDVQLKKRWDLVPQLVETVKGYARHERNVFEKITQARRGIEEAGSASRERFRHEAELGAGVAQVMMLAEDYPELKAGEQFLNLQRNLSEVEAQIAASRRAYNAAVTAWNESVEMFPGSIMAGVFKFQRQDWFEAPDEERKATDVRF